MRGPGQVEIIKMLGRTRAKLAIVASFFIGIGVFFVQYYDIFFSSSEIGCMPNYDGNYTKFDIPTKPAYNIVRFDIPMKQKFECLDLIVIPPTPICIHDPKEDIYVSEDIKKYGAFEIQKLLNVLVSLRSNKNFGLIDIGANIGEYTLAAAKNGHQVVAVEPLKENVERLVMAAQLGGTTEKIILLKNAVSCNHTTVKMIIVGKNIGGSFVHLGENIPYWDCKIIDCTRLEYVQTIYLDDLVPLITFKSAILKIDIEGFERYAFKRADLLFDRVDIQFVYMEWTFFQKRGLFQRSFFKSVQAIVNFFYRRHYVPYSDWDFNFRHPLGAKWLEWPVEIVWKAS